MKPYASGIMRVSREYYDNVIDNKLIDDRLPIVMYAQKYTSCDEKDLILWCYSNKITFADLHHKLLINFKNSLIGHQPLFLNKLVNYNSDNLQVSSVLFLKLHKEVVNQFSSKLKDYLKLYLSEDKKHYLVITKKSSVEGGDLNIKQFIEYLTEIYGELSIPILVSEFNHNY